MTASGRGLGRGIAETLASEGAKIALVARTYKDIEELLNKIGGACEGHIGFATDLEAASGPQSLLDYLRSSDFWPIDIVVHNLGGTLNIADPFCEIEDWRRVWRINMEVAIELNQELIPPNAQQGWGRVVHISSIAAVENHGPVPYCSVKAALSAYSRSMGRVLAPEG